MITPPQDSAPGTSEFLVYTGDDGKAHVQVRQVVGSVWMTQRQIAELFGVSVPTINEHLAGIYIEEELDPSRTIRRARIVQIEGKRSVSRQVEQYALATILAIGYRVRSAQGSIFRQWATASLNEFLVQGYVLDDERLKSETDLQNGHFDELIERIRDIRASERRFYQKIADIFERGSIDYDSNSEVTQAFYAKVLQKLQWAIHANNAGKPILPEGELRELNRVVTMCLDYAEDRAKQRKAMTMADWEAKLDSFLEFNERNVVTHAVEISHEMARAHTEAVQ